MRGDMTSNIILSFLDFSVYWIIINEALPFFLSTASFTALNKNYLTPFFKSRSGDDEEDDHSKNDLIQLT